MEKYGDLVRVVMYSNVSIELCGGTHVKNSSEIGAFVITSEGSVASGVRRIVALSGKKAYEYLKEYQYSINYLSEILTLKEIKDVVPHVKSLVTTKGELEVIVANQKKAALLDFASSLKAISHGGYNLYISVLFDYSRDDLGVIADFVRSKDNSAICVFNSVKDGQNALLISVSKLLTPKLNANKIMKKITSVYNGSGGGRPDFANGSLKETPELNTLITIIKEGLNG